MWEGSKKVKKTRSESAGRGGREGGSVRLSPARLSSARLGSARLGSARLGLGSARLGSARIGSARLGSAGQFCQKNFDNLTGQLIGHPHIYIYIYIYNCVIAFPLLLIVSSFLVSSLPVSSHLGSSTPSCPLPEES